MMMTYKCTNRDCGLIFRAKRAWNCPCCGGRELRHALGYEIDQLEQDGRELVWFPVGLMQQQAG